MKQDTDRTVNLGEALVNFWTASLFRARLAKAVLTVPICFHLFMVRIPSLIDAPSWGYAVGCFSGGLVLLVSWAFGDALIGAARERRDAESEI